MNNIKNLNKINDINGPIHKIYTNKYNTIFISWNCIYIIGKNILRENQYYNNPFLIYLKKDCEKVILLNKCVIIYSKYNFSIISKPSEYIDMLKQKLDCIYSQLNNIHKIKINKNNILALTDDNILYKYLINSNNNEVYYNIDKFILGYDLFGFIKLNDNDNKELFVWGYSYFGRLGSDSYSFKQFEQPHKINLPDNNYVKKVSYNKYHFVIISDNDIGISWGLNLKGQLGLNKLSKEEIPKIINIDKKIKLVSCGLNHSIIVDYSNILYGFGSNDKGQLTGIKDKNNNKKIIFLFKYPNNILKIISDYNHNYLIDEYNDSYSWGSSLHMLIMNNIKTHNKPKKSKSKSQTIKKTKKYKNNITLLKKLKISITKNKKLNKKYKDNQKNIVKNILKTKSVSSHKKITILSNIIDILLEK